MASAECVVDCKCWLGEGPSWNEKENALYWTDVPAKKIFRWNPASGEQMSWDMPEMVASIAPRAQGGLLLASATGIDFFDPDSAALQRFAAPEAERPANRSNDGKCDRQGRFWYGTMMNNFADDGSEREINAATGALYRIDADGAVQRMADNFRISNTFAWSPDNKTMYFADTPNALYAYDFDAETGSIDNRRIFARSSDYADDYGYPDGSTIDAEGFLWNARWGGGCLLRWAPDGSIDKVIKLPCKLVTSAIFGGPDLATLYVTTVRYGLSETELAEQPLAGGIFAVDAGVKGIPDGQFAG